MRISDWSSDVCSSDLIRLNGKTVDASKITKQLLAETLQEFGGVEANVATGYHAIEFLLWGQDLNGTGPGAGERPWTDYSRAACTHGNCDRRAAYLRTATDPPADDIAWHVAQQHGQGTSGAGRSKQHAP